MPDQYLPVPTANYEIIKSSGVQSLMAKIRPHWQSKNLVQRVENLLQVDPSSACQRIFNASIHDLKEKIITAGLDIAQEAAKQYKLPPVDKNEDIDNYSTMKIIDLSYRMGLLSRPEWRRLLRVYDIRKDLEHEDDEYEAGVEDCVYVFKTCIEVVLEKDPIQVLKVVEIKDIVENPAPATITEGVIQDYEHAPTPRQTEIFKFLISYSLNNDNADVIRQNCYNALSILSNKTHRDVVLQCVSEMSERIGRDCPSLDQMRVSCASGILPFLKIAQLKQFYSEYFERMKTIGPRWDKHTHHGELLRNLIEVGGIEYIPNDITKQYIEWLIECYIGEEGGYGTFGRNRNVFYSNSGAPLAMKIITGCTRDITTFLNQAQSSNKKIKSLLKNEHVARRFEDIMDYYENM